MRRSPSIVGDPSPCGGFYRLMTTLLATDQCAIHTETMSEKKLFYVSAYSFCVFQYLADFSWQLAGLPSSMNFGQSGFARLFQFIWQCTSCDRFVLSEIGRVKFWIRTHLRDPDTWDLAVLQKRKYAFRDQLVSR